MFSEGASEPCKQKGNGLNISCLVFLFGLVCLLLAWEVGLDSRSTFHRSAVGFLGLLFASGDLSSCLEESED